MTIAEALAQARQTIPVAEARLLLQHILDMTSAALAAHPEGVLGDQRAASYTALVARRAAGEPIAYLVGRREFFGRQFAVSPAVLIPRPETELLVEIGLAKLRRLARPRILDLGTGSGCVAITLALELAAEVTAIDISADALAVASANADRLGTTITFIVSDWFSGVSGAFDLIVANPPYVADGDPHLREGDLRFEPAYALAGGSDGLSAIRRIIHDAGRHLAPGGWLYFEHGYDQAVAVRELMAAAGFGDIEQHRDLGGIVRVSGARLS
jgi:release factor glutamine methyltransferase